MFAMLKFELRIKLSLTHIFVARIYMYVQIFKCVTIEYSIHISAL